MTFDDEAHATPCFIGQSESASSFDKLVGSVPSPDKLEPPNEKMIVDRTARDDSKWLEMMKTAMTVQENKRHFTKEKKSKQRVATRKGNYFISTLPSLPFTNFFPRMVLPTTSSPALLEPVSTL